ncbi:MAG: glucose-6-phosphate isomerase [Microbacteriaceae bacterium]|nr:glucose-6-phosphate isomerase [Microbacteriaceae bacterium]
MLEVRLPQSWLDELAPVIAQLVADQVASRITQKDFTLWGKAAEAESSIRLGWVESPTLSAPLVDEINDLAKELVAQGVTRVVLCGMGGSSLAPEVITKKFGIKIDVLDSTDPEQVSQVVFRDLAKTVVVVSSKSGSTVETDSQKRIFEKAFTDAGINPLERIVIVTDPGSPMEEAAKQAGYRIFNADPNVGGRYSALTAFGLVPSGLAGVDISKLLQDAAESLNQLSKDDAANPGLILGAVLARSKKEAGYKDKVGIISDQATLPDFADWAEQLIAESTGKEEKGILPLVINSSSFEAQAKLEDVVLVTVSENSQFLSTTDILVSGNLAEQFMLWEYATAVASRIIDVNPFDQPDVESAKVAARGMLAEKSKASTWLFENEGISVNGLNLTIDSVSSVENALAALLSEIGPDSYLSVQAYLNREADLPVDLLREALAKHSSRPVTLGWGPRFLHSTGQYHKGGPRIGVFLQLTTENESDLAVPGRDFSFGELIASQAAGDAKVLADLGRPVLTLRLSSPKADLVKLSQMIEGMK